jgi:hypothetical protein
VAGAPGKATPVIFAKLARTPRRLAPSDKVRGLSEGCLTVAARKVGKFGKEHVGYGKVGKIARLPGEYIAAGNALRFG